MFRFALCSLLLTGSIAHVVADEDEKERTPPPKVFVISVTRLVAKDSHATSAAGMRGEPLRDLMRQWREKDQIVAEESLSLTSVEGNESMVQFGRRISVVSGTTILGGGRTAVNTNWEEVGTIIRAVVTSQADDVLVELTYETSTFQPPEGEQSPGGELGTATVTTQLRLKLGEPQVIAGLQADEQIVYVCDVSEVGQRGASRRDSRVSPSPPRRTRPNFSRPSPPRPTPPRATPSRPSPTRPTPPGSDRKPPIRRSPVKSQPERTSTSPSPESTNRYARFARSLFDRYDSNGDGLIDSEEAKTMRVQFAKYDTNKDGQVSPQEFVDYHTRTRSR